MSDWNQHGFSKRVNAMELAVYQLKDGCRWEVRGELLEVAGFCSELDNAKGRAEDAADAVDQLESLMADGALWGNRAPQPGVPHGRVRVHAHSSKEGGNVNDVDRETSRQAWLALRDRWDLRNHHDVSLARDAFFAGWRACAKRSENEGGT